MCQRSVILEMHVGLVLVFITFHLSFVTLYDIQFNMNPTCPCYKYNIRTEKQTNKDKQDKEEGKKERTHRKLKVNLAPRLEQTEVTNYEKNDT